MYIGMISWAFGECHGLQVVCLQQQVGILFVCLFKKETPFFFNRKGSSTEEGPEVTFDEWPQ